ncbi:MAG: hypothetical protein AB1586_06130 [Pseudomonadota bacterium]|jgi:hypothetical protein
MTAPKKDRDAVRRARDTLAANSGRLKLSASKIEGMSEIEVFAAVARLEHLSPEDDVSAEAGPTTTFGF